MRGSKAAKLCCLYLGSSTEAGRQAGRWRGVAEMGGRTDRAGLTGQRRWEDGPCSDVDSSRARWLHAGSNETRLGESREEEESVWPGPEKEGDGRAQAAL